MSMKSRMPAMTFKSSKIPFNSLYRFICTMFTIVCKKNMAGIRKTYSQMHISP